LNSEKCICTNELKKIYLFTTNLIFCLFLCSREILVTGKTPGRLSCEGGVVTTVAGKVDGTGPTTRFNEPISLTIDEEGQLVVAEFQSQDSVRLVEASLVPPARLASQKETAVHNELRALQTDYGKLLDDAKTC
tara:strand:- start:1857 stop:2258 length:402 start_codon:yes stop_codon:yes gene_type:complete